MKNLKKLLSLFLAVTMIVTSFAAISVSAEEETSASETAQTTKFSDVSKSAKYATAVEVLNKLSIVNGYEDGTFGPDNNVTRAEFAAMLLRMLGLDQTIAPQEAPFPDVAVEYWAAGTIDSAKRSGIITGYEDGTFGPEKNVSYEEALTMIIRAIGYSNYSAPSEIWYSTYVESARRLNITDKADGNVGTLATRACIAQLIYNTLDVYYRENDTIRSQTIMEKYLGIEKKEGIIASNSYTSLSSPDVNLKENEVMIMESETGKTQTYRVDNLTEYDDMLGAKITFYSRSSKNSSYDEIVMFTAKNSVEKQTIDASLLEDSKCQDNVISYYKTSKATSLSTFALDSNNVVIYNGKLYADTAEMSSFAEVLADGNLPDVGQISVLNRDNDSDYDVVFIDAYEHYAVSSVVSSTYTVTDKISSVDGKSVVLDTTDDSQIISFVSNKGAKLSFGSIRKNVAIAVKESNANSGTKLITVVIMNDTVSGEVSAISSNSLKIGSTEYEYSPIAAWKTEDSISAPEKGKKYTLFLDVNGKVFAYVKTESTDEDAKYGYIIGFKQSSSSSMSEEPIYLQILTQTGTKQWIPFAKNTRINGDSINGDYSGAESILADEAEKQAKLDDLRNQAARQLIKYTVKTSNGTTVFDEITTVTDETDTTGGDAEDDELRMFGGFDSNDSVKYSSSSKQFSSGSQKVYLGSAIVFVVPEDMKNSDDYKKGSTSDFTSGKYYHIEAFDISTSKTAKVIVLYGGDSTTPVKATTAYFRVEEIIEDMNDTNNETMLKVIGYEGTSTSLKEYWISPKTESEANRLEKGDIVRFGLDSDGFSTVDSEDILYSASTDAYYFAWDDDRCNGDRPTASEIEYAKDKTSADIKVILGTLVSYDDDYIIISTDEDGDTSDDMEMMRVETSRISNAQFLKYDTDEDPVEITAMTGESSAQIMDSLATYEESGSSAAKVLLIMQSGTVKTIIVIE